MFTAQPALHAENLNAEAARPSLRRRLSATLATAALVLAGLALAPITPASAAPMVTNASTLASAFSAGGVVTLEASFTVEPSDSPIAVPIGSSVTLDLNGNTLTVTGAHLLPAIDVPAGASLTITDSKSAGTLTANGGPFGAGIGSKSRANSGTISIEGGTVIAAGGSGSAGIGNSSSGGGSTVSIAGGTVTAFGGVSGPGIGAGTVSITGGSVSAAGNLTGAGIGGGQEEDGGDIFITGGTVIATSGAYAAAIGGGQDGSGRIVSITGGTVIATSAGLGAGIGGGPQGSGGTVTIGPHATVTAASTRPAQTAIGAGFSGSNFGSLSNAGTLTIPAGSTLDVPGGATAENSGMLNIAGSATGAGTLANTGTIVNTGTITPDTLVTVNNFLVSFTENPDLSTPVRVYASTLDAAQISLPTPTRAGYSFAGWRTAASGGAAWTASTPITGSLSVYAQWTAEPRTVTFDSNGGSSIAPITTGYGATIAAPTNPTRTGHAFAGWFADAATTAFDFATPITANLALTARWSVIPPANTTMAQTVKAGDNVTVSGTGFSAGQQLQLWLRSDPVRLGTLTADSNGTVSSRVTIPANTPAGQHHIVLIDAAGTEYTSGTITVKVESVATALASTGSDPVLPLGLAECERCP